MGNIGSGFTSQRRSPNIGGMIAPGFEEVRDEFEHNFVARGEIGAAVAAYWCGKKVVDLWGGHCDPQRTLPWNEDTMAIVFSTTKGLAAMTIALAVSRGWLDYDAPISQYWPEFSQHGKGHITVRQLLGHEAGLVYLDEKLSIDRLRNLEEMSEFLARQRPVWPPGSRCGYHATTLGLYMQEIIRHADPSHRSLGQFFHEEIAQPLGLDFYIGLPPEVSNERLATMKLFSMLRALKALPRCPPEMILRMLWPWSLLQKSLILREVDWNDRPSLEVELPAGNGVGTARSIARAYSAFAQGGRELGITDETFAELTSIPTIREDEVMGGPVSYSLGFFRSAPYTRFGAGQRAFGTPGAGGSFAFADPDVNLGFAYVMNNMDFYMFDDPREKALREAVYRSIARVSSRSCIVPQRTIPKSEASDLIPIPQGFEPIMDGG